MYFQTAGAGKGRLKRFEKDVLRQKFGLIGIFRCEYGADYPRLRRSLQIFLYINLFKFHVFLLSEQRGASRSYQSAQAGAADKKETAGCRLFLPFQTAFFLQTRGHLKCLVSG